MTLIIYRHSSQVAFVSSSFSFVRGDVLPATSSQPHLIVFVTLLFLLSSSSIIPPLLSSSHLSYHSPPISALASLVWHKTVKGTFPITGIPVILFTMRDIYCMIIAVH